MLRPTPGRKMSVDITALSQGPEHHFFGYYGINPWDGSIKYHLALETDFHERRPEVGDFATVGLIDRQTHLFTPYARTSAFNLQQGGMMHWIDAGFGEEFTFNDWEEGQLVARAVHPETGRMRTIGSAIAAVSPTEPIAMGLNYARMAHCRAVVGYANDMDPKTLEAAPEDDGLFLLDLRSGESRLLFSIADVIQRSGWEEVEGKLAWFNHILFNTDGTRILFFCRAKKEKWPTHQSRYGDGAGRYSSLWTANPDGSGLKCQIPFKYKISHFAWRDAKRILISSDFLGDMQFLEFTDGERDFKPFGEGVLPRDGHMSFSQDGCWLVSDSAPKGTERMSELMLYDVNNNTKVTLGKFHSPEKFTGDIRCDLHPRWSPDGRTISFDSVHEGSRQIYLADVSAVVASSSE
jgi:hypothetical protein